MKLKIKYLIAIFVVILAGCKTTRNLVKLPLKQTPVKQLIVNIQKTETNFTTANISKMAVAVDMNGRKFNVSASCKIRTDSAIFVSIQPFFGIEFFKAEFMPDSIRIFDKMNNRFYAVDYVFLAKRFGLKVDFHSLQALLLGRFFCVGSSGIQSDSCKLTGTNTIEFQNHGLLQSTLVAPDFSITQVLLQSAKYQLLTRYDSYTNQDNVFFPQKISLAANNEKSKVNVDFEILKVAFNVPIIFQTTNPDRFSKGDINQIFKK